MFLYRLSIIIGCVLVPTWAQAEPQTPAPSQEAASQEASSSKAQKLASRLDDLEWMGLKPSVGSVVPGSGPALGFEFRATRRGAVGLGIEGMISVRRYQHLAFQGGMVGGRDTSVRLEPADSFLSSFIRSPGAYRTGWGLYVERRYRRLPRVNFFGSVGDDPTAGAVRTDFGQKVTSTDLVYQWQVSYALGISARVGHMTTDRFPGADGSLPDTEEIFGSALAPALDRPSEYVVAGVGIGLDRRDDHARPTRGALVNVAGWRYSSRSNGFASFSRAAIDARAYHPLFTDRHVLAVRVMGSYATHADEGTIPFQFMHHLGGPRSLRSFHSYQFRGARVAAASVESRWRAWRFLELMLFADAGEVDRPAVALGLPNRNTSAGGGVRVWISDGFVIRGELAKGRGGTRFLTTLGRPY